MSRINWQRISDANRMRQHGTEDRKGGDAPPIPWTRPRRRQPTKEELRRQAEAAVRAFQQRIE